jgi:ferritin-like metal-binding protein YciE
MESLQDLFEDQLKDLYNAEKQLVKALPGMAKKASTPSLKNAFTFHLEETKGHVQRLETVGGTLSIKLTGKTCKAMEGLIEEGKEVIAEKGNPLVIDEALIAAAQRVEHYEMAAYGSARALAETLGQEEALELLQATLDEETAADEKLNTISLEEILPDAPKGADDGEEDENSEEETVTQPGVRAARKAR